MMSFRYKQTFVRYAVCCAAMGLVGVAQAQSGDKDKNRDKQPIGLQTVVVTGTKTVTDVRQLPMTITVVDWETIEAANEPSLMPVLARQVPGLFVTSRGVMGYGVSGGAAGNISFRGLSGGSAQMLVLVDGHPQYMGLMGHPLADVCQSYMADRVEVVHGPASVLYGSNAMGGVVNIVTRRRDKEGVNTHFDLGYGSYNTLQTAVTNEVRKGRFSSVAGGTYDRTDGHRPDMGFGQYGGTVRLGYDVSRHWNATVDVDITHFNASQPGAVTAPLRDADQWVTRGMASAAVQNNYGRSSGALTFFYNWGHHRINDGYSAIPDRHESPLPYRFVSDDKMMGLSWYQSARLFAGNRLTVGLDYYHFGGKAYNKYVEGEKTGQRTWLVDKTQDEIAGYATMRQQVGAWLTLDAGIRADHHSGMGTEWIPQVGAVVHFPAGLDVKLSAAKGFRYPTIREMYMFPPQNPGLKPESLWDYDLSVSQRLLDGALDYSVNAFYIKGKNLIVAVPRQGATPLNMNTGEVENAGVEVQAAYRLSPAWQVDGNYSYLHMAHPVVTAPKHKLFAEVVFTPQRFRLSTGLQYVNGLYTQVAMNGTGEDKTENFLLWNVSGAYHVLPNLDVWVRGENLLAQRYEINAGYPMPRATVFVGLKVNF